MFTERWHGSRRASWFQHDGHVGLSGDVKGQRVRQIRQQLVQQEVASSVEVKPLLLRQHFLEHGNMEDANLVEKVDLTAIRVRGGRVVNEVSFAGTSFLEGFLSVYGIELERAVRRYEEKLQLFETLDHKRQQRVIFVGRLKQGELQQLSPSFETVEQANEQLEEMKKGREKERATEPNLQMEQEK
ncbi:hypothetical protein [Metasolibacillus meyeri]|uniref:hypothetical protein n=1 Tax=Metasolibacillus meyeri TaxID=1071052 RepID=UPI000D305BD5|nr:hypothetical protein [Metasolibacillus meyeri]